MISEFGNVLIFFLAGFALVFAMLFLSKKIRQSDNPNDEKNSIYESGEDSVGHSFPMLNMRFFIIALIFLLFDVELIFLFPWAVVFGDVNLNVASHFQWAIFTGLEMLFFILVLAVGLAYVWKEGYLEWALPKKKETIFESNVPDEMYEKVNEKYS